MAEQNLSVSDVGCSNPLMISRRVFRQLTDRVLLDASFLRPCHCLCRPHGLRIGHPQPLNFLQHGFPRSKTSSTRWQTRQSKDRFVQEAKVRGLMSRAAFKLLQMDETYKVFSPGQTVVDLGYAPGSWSQVAITKVGRAGRVVGIDIIPTQPPTGVSTIQGNFLSPAIQAEVRAYVRDPERGRRKRRMVVSQDPDPEEDNRALGEEEVEEAARSYIDSERHAHLDTHDLDGEAKCDAATGARKSRPKSVREQDAENGRVVDVVLSDMSAPWDQTTGKWIKSVSNPYFRMMNTSGNRFRDHAGSMDLCMAALTFCYDALKTGGKFVCKFYQGSEDKAFENRLKKLFTKVVREKPESSRSESKEAYFVAMGRKTQPAREEVLGE